MGLRTNDMGTDGRWWAVRACPVPGRRFPAFQGCGGAPRHSRSACEFPNAWSWDANRHNLHTRGREREGGGGSRQGGSGRGGTEARGPTPLLCTNFLDRLAVGNPRPRPRPRPLPSTSASAGPAPFLEEPASSSGELNSAPVGPSAALAPVGPAAALSDRLAAGNPRPRPRPCPLPAPAGPAPSVEQPASSSGDLTSARAGPAAALAHVGPAPALLDSLAAGNPRPRPRPCPLPAPAGPAPSLEEPASSLGELTPAPAGPAAAPVGPAPVPAPAPAPAGPAPAPAPAPVVPAPAPAPAPAVPAPPPASPMPPPKGMPTARLSTLVLSIFEAAVAFTSGMPLLRAFLGINDIPVLTGPSSWAPGRGHLAGSIIAGALGFDSLYAARARNMVSHMLCRLDRAFFAMSSQILLTFLRILESVVYASIPRGAIPSWLAAHSQNSLHLLVPASPAPSAKKYWVVTRYISMCASVRPLHTPHFIIRQLAPCI